MSWSVLTFNLDLIGSQIEKSFINNYNIHVSVPLRAGLGRNRPESIEGQDGLCASGDPESPVTMG